VFVSCLGLAAGEPERPRLLFTKADTDRFRKLIDYKELIEGLDEEPAKVDPQKTADPLGISIKSLWQDIAAAADAACKNPITPGFGETPGRKTVNHWGPLSLAYGVTGKKKYLEQIKEDLATVSGPGWRTWGSVHEFAILRLTMGVAGALDAAWNDLTEGERRAAADALAKKGIVPLYNAGKGGKFILPSNNGCVYYAAALGLGGLALRGEKAFPDADKWVDAARDTLKGIMDKSDPDGSWSEGLGYGTIAWDGMGGIAFMDALRRVRGENLFAHPYLKNLAFFGLHTMRPTGSGGVGFNDTWQGNGFHLLAYRMASEMEAPYLVWYVKKAGYRGGGEIEEKINLFLNYREGLTSKSPEGLLPVSRHFRGMGWVTCRTRWEDPDATLFAMQTEPLGHPHEHNSMNHFEIHAFGSRLATSPGYHHGIGWRATYGHNLIWVDGNGQNNDMIGKPGGDIMEFLGSDFFDYVEGEAHPYGTPEAPTIESWRRRVVFAKPDYVVVFDDIRSVNQIPREFKWVLQVTVEHCLGQKGVFKMDGPAAAVSLPQAPDPQTGQLYTRFLLPAESVVQPAVWTGHKASIDLNYLAVMPREKKPRERFLAVLYPQPRNAPPPDIKGFEVAGGQGIEVAVPGGRNLHLYRLAGERVAGKGLETDGVTCMAGLAEDGGLVSFALVEGKELKRDGKALVSCDQPVCAAFAKWSTYTRRQDRLPLKTVEPNSLYGVAKLAKNGVLRFFVGRAPKTVAADDREATEAVFDSASGMLSIPLASGEHKITVRLKP